MLVHITSTIRAAVFDGKVIGIWDLILHPPASIGTATYGMAFMS